MKIILNDRTKFEKLGPSSSHDRTSTAEASLNKFLDELKDNGELSKELYDSLRSTGGTRPRMYGLPKVHKVGAPLWQILSMSGSPQYVTSKWLCKLLQPVRKKYSKWCIKDSFQFIDLLKKKKIGSNGFMCSLDVVSLFTKVPLEETIKICADALYRDDDVEPEYTALSEDSLCSLLRMVTSGVEFSFDDVMYRQTDGVAMGSPLGPVIADIFVGWCESRIPDEAWPQMYCRFVDDSFAHVDHRQDCERFLEILNSLHSALQYTCELENDGRLPYLDVSIEKSKNDGISWHRSIVNPPLLVYNAPLAVRYPPDIRPRPLPGLIFSNIRPRSVTNWISTCGLNRFAACSLRSAECHLVKPTANLVCVISEVTGAQVVTAAQHTLPRVGSL